MKIKKKERNSGKDVALMKGKRDKGKEKYRSD